MAENPAERALSDSGGTRKVVVPQRDGELSTAVEAAQDFVAASRSKATLRAYRSDWHDFEKWCDRHCLIALLGRFPDVAAYLSAMAIGRLAKLATIRRRLATIDTRIGARTGKALRTILWSRGPWPGSRAPSARQERRRLR